MEWFGEKAELEALLEVGENAWDEIEFDEIEVKRCHDRGRSGWFLLINFIPIIGALWLWVELCFLRGTKGPSRFGPDPLGN